MRSALIVSSSTKSVESIRELLEKHPFDYILTADNSKDMQKHCTLRKDLSCIIINAPLMDGSERDAALLAASSSHAAIIYLTKESEESTRKLFTEGIYILPKPFTKGVFHAAIQYCLALEKRMAFLLEENNQLRNELDAIKLISRAKFMLMQYLNMTEPQAHRYIEKQSMDLHQTKTETALNILNTYENRF